MTIYLQKDSPGPAKEANWLPAPAGQCYLLLRAYAPGEALLRSLTEPDGFHAKFVVDCLGGSRRQRPEACYQHIGTGSKERGATSA